MARKEKKRQSVRLSHTATTFALLDADASGTICRDELQAALIALGQPSGDDDIKRLLQSVGLDDTENVEISEELFMSLLKRSDVGESGLLEYDEIVGMFNTIDLDGSGYITASELQHFLGNLRIFLDDEQMLTLVHLYDQNGDARIALDEFQRIVEDLGFDICNAPNPNVIEEGTEEEEDDASGEEEEQKDELEEEKKEGTDTASVKLLSLDSIEDPDLRKVLAKFDLEKTGSVNLSFLNEIADNTISTRLHWSKNRPRVPLADHVTKVNHIAITVSDVTRSTRFYTNVMGFEQIRRPNFYANGAWLTMGNCELHLIKGAPVVPGGDDLVVGHLSLDATDIQGLQSKLRSMNIPFRKNLAVPSGANADNNMIVEQYFVRDPDGYYVEICNCEVLTEYCLGEKPISDLGYEEGVKSLSLSTCAATIQIMHRWIDKLKSHESSMAMYKSIVKEETDGSIQQVAELLDCDPALEVDQTIFKNLVNRRSIYGDVCQNEEEEDIKAILLATGNDAIKANDVMILREKYHGTKTFRPPGFIENGEYVTPPSIVKQFKSSIRMTQEQKEKLDIEVEDNRKHFTV
mmetsp:Transcript_7977/g.11515  ORF Transcript_7977/g.11515 Transcript_7977/m.11515 type:complete len:577 (-) Transcript_7977:235-1965(-)